MKTLKNILLEPRSIQLELNSAREFEGSAIRLLVDLYLECWSVLLHNVDIGVGRNLKA